MSRCKACDIPLSDKHTPVYNKFSKCEEDLCGVCKRMSKLTQLPKEYLFGTNPQEGLTQPRNNIE